jgi:uncharacterized DUF497 family protein
MRTRIEKTAKSTAFLLRLRWKSSTIRFCLTNQDRIVEGEQRLWTLGRVEDLLKILVVVHTVMEQGDEEVIRIISARKATPRERGFYEEVDR